MKTKTKSALIIFLFFVFIAEGAKENQKAEWRGKKDGHLSEIEINSHRERIYQIFGGALMKGRKWLPEEKLAIVLEGI